MCAWLLIHSSPSPPAPTPCPPTRAKPPESVPTGSILQFLGKWRSAGPWLQPPTQVVLWGESALGGAGGRRHHRFHHSD